MLSGGEEINEQQVQLKICNLYHIGEQNPEEKCITFLALWLGGLWQTTMPTTVHDGQSMIVHNDQTTICSHNDNISNLIGSLSAVP